MENYGFQEDSLLQSLGQNMLPYSKRNFTNVIQNTNRLILDMESILNYLGEPNVIHTSL